MQSQRHQQKQHLASETPTPPSKRLPPYEPARGWPRALGALSLALGLPAVVAPRATARLLGMPLSATATATLRAVGIRELGVGLGLLAMKRAPATWTWLRVAGDAIDIALLAGATTSRSAERGRLAATAALVSAITVLDGMAAVTQSRK